jgi:hypothetical protein
VSAESGAGILCQFHLVAAVIDDLFDNRLLAAFDFDDYFYH